MIPLKRNNFKLIKPLNKVLSAFIAIVFLVLTLSSYATALTIDCTVENIKLVGMSVNAYLVKDKLGRVVEPYSDYNIDFNFSTAEEVRNLASTLEAYTLYNSVTPTATTVTDQNGKAHFNNLEEGLYLILIPNFEQNGVTYVSEPSLILNEDDEEELTVIPKISPTEQTEQTLKVLKIWDDDNINRPDQITVVLLCDGEEYSTITLSEENNWHYTWQELPGNHHWTIVEIQLEGYNVEIYLDGITFVIKNTKETPTTPPTTDPDVPSTPDTTNPDDTSSSQITTTKPGDSSEPSEKLPQTGQLWWPVPVLFFLALVFIILGLLQRKGEHYEK